jgi:hypothetical protein
MSKKSRPREDPAVRGRSCFELPHEAKGKVPSFRFKVPSQNFGIRLVGELGTWNLKLETTWHAMLHAI